MNFYELHECVKSLNSYSRPEQIRILEGLAFGYYLRKGTVPAWVVAYRKLAAAAPLNFKFNPWHDNLGRFTSGPNSVTPVSDSTENTQAPKSWGDSKTFQDHFERHASDFDAKSPEDYADQANQFLKRAEQENLPAVQDSDGTLRIYDPSTNTFGSYNSNGTTKTFFKPTEGSAYFQEQINEDLSNGGRMINPLPQGGSGGGGQAPIGKPNLDRNPLDQIEE